MRRFALCLTAAVLCLGLGTQHVHATVNGAPFTGDGDSQVDYLTSGCQLGVNGASSPCAWFSAGSGSASIGQSQYSFRYVLGATILLSQASFNDGRFCAPVQGQMLTQGDTLQGSSTITMTLIGAACLQGTTWNFTGRFVATGTSGMFAGGSGSGSFTAMVTADRPGGGCIMWSGTFVLVGL